MSIDITHRRFRSSDEPDQFDVLKARIAPCEVADKFAWAMLAMRLRRARERLCELP
jgi:hypothetical protein